jgi:hypothetical protein
MLCVDLRYDISYDLTYEIDHREGQGVGSRKFFLELAFLV